MRTLEDRELRRLHGDGGELSPVYNGTFDWRNAVDVRRLAEAIVSPPVPLSRGGTLLLENDATWDHGHEEFGRLFEIFRLGPYPAHGERPVRCLIEYEGADLPEISELLEAVLRHPAHTSISFATADRSLLLRISAVGSLAVFSDTARRSPTLAKLWDALRDVHLYPPLP